MKEELFKLFNVESLNPPTSLEKIIKTEIELEITLPDEYKEFLLISNGYEGSIGEAYVQLWTLEELAPMNEGYCVKKFAPDLFLIGSDGGGEAYGFNIRKNGMPLIRTPFIGMDEFEEHSKTFFEFIENLYQGRW